MLKAIHVYEHDAVQFQVLVNRALAEIEERRGVVHEVDYAIDPSTRDNHKGGYGALVLFEVEQDDEHTELADDDEIEAEPDAARG